MKAEKRETEKFAGADFSFAFLPLRCLFFMFPLLLMVPIECSQAAEVQKSVYIYGETLGGYSSDEEKLNFSLGQIDILGLILAGRGEGFIELVFEQPEGEEDFIIDVERLYAGYRFHSLATLRLGRFHTPFGYFTRRWHHGQYLMPQINRPVVIEFEDEGGPLPIHLIGFELEGKTKKLGYILNIGNGNLQFGSDNISDFDVLKSAVGKIYFKPTLFSEVGISVGYDPFVLRLENKEIDVRNLVLGGNLAYDFPGKLRVIAEGFLFNELESEKMGFGGFVLASYPVLKNIRGYIDEVIPYIQVEFINWEDGNPWFDELSKRGLTKKVGVLGGVKFVITSETAIKFEFRYDIIPAEGGGNIWGIFTQFGFGLPLFE